MSQNITLSLLAPTPFQPQTSSHQDIASQILAFWQDQLQAVWPSRPDLVLLPECCNLPHEFPIEQWRPYAEQTRDQFEVFFGELAREHQCYIAFAPCRLNPNGTLLNSVQMLDRTGQTLGQYDKTHLTLSEIDEGGLVCGQGPVLFETDFGRIGTAICFDLNFDSLKQRYQKLKPDLMLFSSMFHGGLQQTSWAYDLRCHFAAAIWDLPSAILSPVGQTLATTTNYTRHVTETINLDCQLIHLDYHAEKLRAMKKKYGQAVTITDPGLLGSVLVTSESPDRTAMDLFVEFQMQPLDAYLQQALTQQQA